MPVNVTVQEPRTRIVCREPEGNIVRSTSDVDNIAPDRVIVVIFSATSHADDVEVVSVQMHRMLETHGTP